MTIWGKILLTADLALVGLLVRSTVLMASSKKKAGERLLHVYPAPWLLAGTMFVNFFGMFATAFSFAKTLNIIYLLFLSVFILNSMTVLQRLVDVHEEGIIARGRLFSFRDMKKVTWGMEDKKFVPLQIAMRDKDEAPIFVSIPLPIRETLASKLRGRVRS